MKSVVIETNDKVFIENIPEMFFGKNTENTFIRSVQLALNALGESYSYDYLMGISGVAFRLHFHPDWCPSSADPTTGFDVSKVLFKSLSYEAQFYSIDDNSFNDIRNLYQKIITQIDLGFPIVAINLKVCPDWGIITGYLKNKPGILCRTYYDDNIEYSLAERAPWLSFFIGEKGEEIITDNLFINSLRIAVELAKTEEFGEYISGFKAFEKWIEELKKLKEPKKVKKYIDKTETNWIIFNGLLDSRKAVLNYLASEFYNEVIKFNNANQIINNYKKSVALLNETQKNILPSINDKPDNWSKEVINKQIDVLEQVLRIEKETINIIEEELNNLVNNN